MTKGRKIYWASVAVVYTGAGLAWAAAAIADKARKTGHTARDSEVTALKKQLFAERQKRQPITFPGHLARAVAPAALASKDRSPGGGGDGNVVAFAK